MRNTVLKEKPKSKSVRKFWKMTVNDKTFVTDTHDILGRISKKPGRRYYLSGNNIVEVTEKVVGTWRVHGHYEDEACTKRIKI